ncbi:MAG TPA: hypothetical protein VLG16_02125 [Candidatus Saccharimonadales bacterium]|nr:hypothetical protein [Candidatus Saccharimonadales bacterium]
MTNPHGCEHPHTPATTAEANVTSETLISDEWLHAFNPATFTPRLWASDRQSKAKIALRPPEGQNGGLAVERFISGWYNDNTREIIDEPHFGVGIVGENGFVTDLPQLKYAFDEQGRVIKDKVRVARDESLGTMISEMGRLVFIPGSTITGSSDVFGIESRFVSDGEQWIDENTRQPLVPSAATARLAIEASE